MKVKIFDCDYASELERKMNDFIEEIEKQHMEVKDIKYSTPHDGDMYCFSALIMYGPDGKVYLATPNYERYYEENVREDGTYECREVYKEVV